MPDNYSREDVEVALWLMWDPQWCYGPGADPRAAEGDMPRSATNPSKGGTWMASVMDVREAWKRAGLTDAERRRLGYHYYSGLTPKQIGAAEGVSKQAAQQACDSGLSRIVRTINNLYRKEVAA